MLTLGGAVADLALSADAQGVLQRMVRLALVEADLGAAGAFQLGVSFRPQPELTPLKRSSFVKVYASTRLHIYTIIDCGGHRRQYPPVSYEAPSAMRSAPSLRTGPIRNGAAATSDTSRPYNHGRSSARSGGYIVTYCARRGRTVRFGLAPCGKS